MLPLEIMLPIDFTAVLCWAQHHCTVLHLVGVAPYCGAPHHHLPHSVALMYSTAPYWSSSSSSPYCGACCTEGEVNMLHGIGGTQGEEVVIGQVVESLALFFWFLDFCQSQVPIWATKIKICKNCNFSEIFGNFRKFWPIFAIFGHFWPFGSASWAFWPEKWKFLILLWKNCYFGCGPCGPGGPPGPLGPPGPWCKSIFSPI